MLNIKEQEISNKDLKNRIRTVKNQYAIHQEKVAKSKVQKVNHKM